MKQLRARELESTTKPEDRLHATPIGLTLLIGCLIVANVMFRVPDGGLTVEQFNTFAGP